MTFYIKTASGFQAVPAATRTPTAGQTVLLNLIDKIPFPLNTAGQTSLTGLFKDLPALVEAPMIDTSSATSLIDIFRNDTLLATVPAWNTSNVTNFNGAFFGVKKITALPPWNFSAAQTLRSTFSPNGGAHLLTSATLDLPAATDIFEMFAYCGSPFATANLTSLGNVTSASGVFQSCSGLTNLTMGGMRASFSVQNSNLDATRLNTLFTSLGTALGGAVVTISGTPGSGACNRSIATAKGWTVTG
jgi:hypothetical protein